MSRTADRHDDIHQHPGWLIPLVFAAAILALCGLFLLWYLRPGPKPRVGAPSAQSTLVQITVHGTAFAIPANYIESAAARSGGAQDTLALFALFPSMRGYSGVDAALFAGNAPDSPLIHLVLRGDTNILDAKNRLARIYMPYVAGPGMASPFGLTQYRFRPDSGYGRDDLFVGDTSGGPLLLLCERLAPDLPSPNCSAIDGPLAGNLSFSYRFKRAYLARWREMAADADGLISRFAKKR
jgi:hypothetical protein